jgi:hypothetical protein
MNREEFTALLAQTHSNPQPHSSTPSPTRPERRHHIKPTSPLSPRQIFQSRVRTLSDDEEPSAVPQPSPTQPSCELQHLSSLRVHVRDSDRLSLHLPSHNPHRYRSKNGRFDFSSAEPDFVAEERAAWNRDPPTDRAQDVDHAASWANNHSTLRRHPDFVPELEKDADDGIQSATPLQPFAPMSHSVDENERPKTSRGPGSAIDTFPGAFPQEEATSNEQISRRSRFLEGSMTDRSVAVASTWSKHGVRLSESSERSAEDTHTDATPRAARVSRDNGSSFDLSDFRPLPITPSTIKGKLSKLVKRPRETSSKPVEDGNKQKKKGLRKSISTWSFHNIGDKVKFFGASSTDLPEGQDNSKHEKNTHLAELNERKRKAEEVYAQQFGMKKQKSNDGIPVQDPKLRRTPILPRTLKKRPVSQRTIAPATATRRRRDVSNASSTTVRDPADMLSDSDYDHRKRPSRSELEKENYQLRAMLRERQAQQVGPMHPSASKPSFHLTINGTSQQPSSSVSSVSHSTPGSVAISNADTVNQAKVVKQKQLQNKAIPPVPALPSRAVLASLGSHGRNAGTPPADTITMKRTRGRFPRPVSMILEEDDVENDQSGTKDEIPWKSRSPMSPQHPTLASHAGPRPDNWEWPDDVF